MKFKSLLVAAAGVSALGLATAAHADPLSGVIFTAPTADVGKDTLTKGTIQFSASQGQADNFSVGTSTAINASASASSTSDYNVKSTAVFDVSGATDGSTMINQTIGTSGSVMNSFNNTSSIDIDKSAASSIEKNFEQTARTDGGNSYWWWRNNTTNQWESGTKEERDQAYSEQYTAAKQELQESLSSSGTISGEFTKTDDLAGTSSNNVTVKGIGAANSVVGGTNASFETTINKNLVEVSEGVYGASDSAGTASGSAAGVVNTTASANANSSSFVNTFVQAY